MLSLFGDAGKSTPGPVGIQGGPAGERLQEVRGASGRRGRQRPVPGGEELAQLTAQGPQTAKARVELGQPAGHEVADRAARRRAAIALGEDARQLVEGEADDEGTLDEPHARRRLGGVAAIAVGAARCLRDHALPLVVAQRVGAHAALARHLARAERGWRAPVHRGVIDGGSPVRWSAIWKARKRWSAASASAFVVTMST